MPKPLRVVYLIERLARAGTELHLLRLLERIDRRRFEPVICCLNGDRTDRDLVPDDVAFHHLHAPWNLVSPKTLGVYRRLKALLREQRPDVLHTFLFVANIMGPFAVRRVAPRPAVVMARGRMGIEWQAHALHRLAQRAANRRADALTVKTEAMRREIAEREGVDPRKLHVVPNGVDLAFFHRPPGAIADSRRHLAEAHGISPEGPMVLSVGNLKPIKGHATMLDAAARLVGDYPRLRVVLVGDGESAGDLRALRDALGLGECVYFAGTVEDVRPWMRAADIFVAPSHSEGMPNAVLEAMAMGLPIVLSDIPGHCEAAGHAAWYFPPRDASALAESLRAALASPEKRAERGRAAHERAESHFSIAAMVRAVEAIYDTIAEERRP